MTLQETKIVFTVLYYSVEYNLQTFHGEYRDLKCLIQDRLYAEDFGQCGGMGRCATCMVVINGLKGKASLLRRNEAVTLKRMSQEGADIRLACQIPVDDNLSNTVIRVLENT